jgi:hypothetical protein
LPELLPPLLAFIIDPAAREMHNQIAGLPLHGIVALRVGVRDALLDQAEVLPEDFVVLDEV